MTAPPPIQGPTSQPGSPRWAVFAIVGLAVVLLAAGIRTVVLNAKPTPRRPTIAEAMPEPWQVHLARAAGTQIRWLMPATTGIDGPRSLLHIPAPAIGTFWVSMPVTENLRYDGTLLQDVGPASSDPKALVVDAVDRLDGEAPIDFGDVVQSGGAAEVDYIEQFDNRTYVGHAYAWSGQVFTLSVAYPADRVDLRMKAHDELHAMQGDVTFAPV